MKDKCAFDAETCWFSHKKLDEGSCYQRMEEYKCVYCDETFHVKSEFMKHKKNHHSNNVASCKNYKKDLTCKFGEKCWFIHKENCTKNIIENQQNNGVTEKIIIQILLHSEKITKKI